jgi:predicted nucleic acid-binding protein
VIVVDTSAWVDLSRASGSPADRRLRRALERTEEIAVTEVVVAEMLSGARTERELADWRNLLLGFPLLRLRGLADFEAAAGLQRVCRDRGETIRGLPDCLVAIPAITARVPVLHCDRDFDVLARHTPLEVVPLDE